MPPTRTATRTPTENGNDAKRVTIRHVPSELQDELALAKAWAKRQGVSLEINDLWIHGVRLALDELYKKVGRPGG